MRALLFDSETTGFKDPEIIEAASIELPEVSELRALGWEGALAGLTMTEQRYRPSKPVSFGAMATHHITNGMLAGKPPSSDFSLPMNLDFLVGHAVDFDWRAARSPEDVRRICTLAFSRYLWPDVDSHSLGAMIYFFLGEPAREMCLRAHGALADCQMTLYLLLRVLEVRPNIQTWEQLYDASEQARVPRRFTFGKYGPKNGEKGMEIARVRAYDPGYHDWLLSGKCSQVEDDPYLRQALEQ